MKNFILKSSKMKNLKFAIILFIAVMSLLQVTEIKAQSVSVNFSLFQRELSPHGQWMTSPRFGEVWIYSDPSFRPYYTDGHWEYTNYGWSWVSDFDWGWAPFHYGRWENDPDYGWMWIPGYDWGAAWVSWSSYNDYYGWAPLGYGVNINASFGSIPYDRWAFIPRRNICDRDINRYYVSPERDRGFRNAVVINNYYEGDGGRERFMRGPERNEVERYTHNQIQERKIDDRERQGRWTANNDNNGGRRDNGNNNTNGRRSNDRQVNGDNNNQRGNGNFPGRKDNANNNNNGGRSNDRQVNGDNNNQRGNGNFPGRKDNANNNNNGGRNDGRQVNGDNNNQRGNGNFPGRKDDNINRQPGPGRDINNNPQQNNNRQYDNRMNRQQQNNFPPQQQVERQGRQQQPAMEQRSMERRNDQGNGGQGQQRSSDNGVGNRGGHGGKRG